MTRNDYDGEIPEKHDVSLFIIHSKGDARMKDKDRNLQHAIREAGTAAAAWPFLAAGGLVLLALVPIAIGRRHLDL